MPNVMAAQPNIGGALCESSAIPFHVRYHAAMFGWPRCWSAVYSNAVNVGERKNWTQSELVFTFGGC